MRRHAKAIVATSALLLTLALGASSASASIEVNLAGPGEGKVTSAPAGIDCSNVGGGTPGPACSGDFPSQDGTGEFFFVQLTANPAPGSIFVGWAGDDIGNWEGFGQGPTCNEGKGNPCTTVDLEQYLEDPSYTTHITATFTPPPDPPTVIIDPTTGVDQDSAHLSGTINPNSPTADPLAAVDWHFECTPKCPSAEAVGHIDPDDTDHPVEADATGLKPSTSYKVKLVAGNAGPAVSAETEFETDPVAPLAYPAAKTPAGPYAMTIRGWVNPQNSQLSECRFEYGTTTSYGQSVNCEELPGEVEENALVSTTLKGLAAGEAYHYKLVVANDGGSAESADTSFGVLAPPPSKTCPNQGALGASFLPDCRAWEMVSPPDKKGGEVIGSTQRTRAAADGSAVGFASLTPFADAIGTGVATDYIAQRSSHPDPGNNGWSTHAITPMEKGNSYEASTSIIEPLYLGTLSENLDRGVYSTRTPQTDDPTVAKVQNLYLRTDLRIPGRGSYGLLTACPACSDGLPEPADGPLPVPTNAGKAIRTMPVLVGASPDFGRVVFESSQRLTADPGWQDDRTRLYESNNGEVRLVGRIPSSGVECDDQVGSTCEAPDVSIGGSGAGEGASHGAPSLVPHVISDHSDGHSRVFFTRPTNDGISSASTNYEGDIYMRVDGHKTVQLNISENSDFTGFAKSRFLDASADGARAFFSSQKNLTQDASGGGEKLYMYDALKPALAPDNLSLLSVDEEPSDLPGSVRAVVGVGGQGRYVYFLSTSQLVHKEAPGLSNKIGMYVWHEGEVAFIGDLGDEEEAAREQYGSGPNHQLIPRQARVSPDGKYLLFTAIKGDGLLRDDHGACKGPLGTGCRELYVYSASTNTLQCASCSPGGAVPTAAASVWVNQGMGSAKYTTYENNAVSSNGRYVFFSTPQRLVSSDVNGVSDAYLYDIRTGEPRLLSSGKDSGPSYFLDASADGSNAFIRTAERLSGWDVDAASDLYDVRVDGGFPEPPPPPPSCVGDACQPAPRNFDDLSPGTAAISAPGDRTSNRKRRCARGQRRVKVRNGKSRCVRRGKRADNTNRRAGK